MLREPMHSCFFETLQLLANDDKKWAMTVEGETMRLIPP